METVKRDYMPKDTVEFGPKAAAQELSIKSIWFEFLEAQNPIDCFDSNSDVVFELTH